MTVLHGCIARAIIRGYGSIEKGKQRDDMERNTALPVVSVFMTTYYHEKYVAQAIESVLAQKVDFPIQIVISDDASQDGTQKIIRAYAEKYPFIKININETNIGLSANMFLAKSLCDGTYISDLSGDDYWIDEYKLQKQVDFLRKHPDYYAVCNRLEMRADNETVAMDVVPEISLCSREFTMKMFLSGENYPLNGFMMHNPFLNQEDAAWFSLMPKMSRYIDDLTDCILILLRGKVWILPEAMAAYRVRRKTKDDKNFNSQNTGLRSYVRHMELLNNLYTHFGTELDMFRRFQIVIFPGLRIAIKTHNMKNFWQVYKTAPKCYRKRGLLLRSAAAMVADFVRARISK